MVSVKMFFRVFHFSSFRNLLSLSTFYIPFFLILLPFFPISLLQFPVFLVLLYFLSYLLCFNLLSFSFLFTFHFLSFLFLPFFLISSFQYISFYPLHSYAFFLSIRLISISSKIKIGF